MTDRAAATSPLVYARVAGVAYLLIMICAVLSQAFVDSKLIVSGNDAVTGNNIVAHDTLFRFGIVGVLIIYASVVVLAHSLFVILKPVNQNLALLAMLLRIAEAILGGATMLASFAVLALLDGKGPATAFEPEQLHALVGVVLNVRTAGLDIVLAFVGLGGTVFCYLLFQSKLIPRVLAAWGVFTYSSMLALSVVSILFPNHPVMLETVLYALGGLFEFIIGGWLLLKGVDVRQWASYASAEQSTLVATTLS
ncbi:MAG: DUF4386 domain-containing protein [Deltaproteobacteria bacterium]|nr:DUF4386 domain-containing protein [Deltaproteobacteria bacterium]